MLILERILGHAGDPEMADRLHDLEHHGQVETLILSGEDVQRHRMRVRTDRGTDCAIRLERHDHLSDGAVLWLDAHRAIVVQLDAPRHLVLEPCGAAAALELGYFAGNMHWKVRFQQQRLQIVLAGPEAAYLERLEPMLSSGRIQRCST